MIQIISWRTTLGTSPTPQAPDIPWPLLWRPMTMACGGRRSSSFMEGKRKGMVQCARNRSSLLPCWRKIRNAGKAFFRYRTEWRIKSSRTGLLSLVPAVLGKHRGPTDSIFKVACTLDPGLGLGDSGNSGSPNPVKNSTHGKNVARKTTLSLASED